MSCSKFSLQRYRNSFVLGAKKLETFPTESTELFSLNGFKKAIKKWKPVNCPCRLCKMYIHHAGFIS